MQMKVVWRHHDGLILRKKPALCSIVESSGSILNLKWTKNIMKFLAV